MSSATLLLAFQSYCPADVQACLGPTPAFCLQGQLTCLAQTNQLSAGMRKLQDLSLAGCDGLTGPGLAYLAGLTALTSLNLEQWRDLATLRSLAGQALPLQAVQSIQKSG